MKHFTGAWLLIAIAFRRDRVQLSIWVQADAAFSAFVAAAVKAVIETEAELLNFAELYVVNWTMRLFRLACGLSDGGLVMSWNYDNSSRPGDTLRDIRRRWAVARAHFY